MVLKTIKLDGFCRDIGKLTKINFRYIHTDEEVPVPVPCQHDHCPVKRPAHQKEICQTILSQAVQRIKASRSIEKCIFKCGLVKLVFPIYSSGTLCGVVLSDGIRQVPERERLKERRSPLPSLNPQQIDSLASILDANRRILQEEVISHREFTPGSRNKILIEEAKRYIEQNYYNSHLSLKDLLGKVHSSYYHLCRLFKKELKISFVEYLTWIRLKKALKLLENDRLTIAQVAYAVGFSEAQYFSRIFKKYLYCSPSEFRHSSKKKRNDKRNKVLSALDNV